MAQHADVVSIGAGVYGKRPGADFDARELGAGIAMTQIANNGEAGLLAALLIVFSEERARAILAAMAGVEPVFIGNNCG